MWRSWYIWAVMVVAAWLVGCSTRQHPARVENPPSAAERARAAAEAAATQPAVANPRQRLGDALRLVYAAEYREALPELRQLWADLQQVPVDPEDGGQQRAPSPRPEAEELPEVLFWIGYCNEKIRRPEVARAFYSRVMRGWPGRPAARQAHRRLYALQAAR